MSSSLQPVRGTHDLLPEAMRAHRRVVECARELSALAGFEEVSTPIFEFSEVFHRTLGETSDVVSKETYSFEDRGGESLTLRPEFTASLARAFISNGMQSSLPCKWFYSGPAFRYERPQKGRQRQFHQIGVEWLGTAAYQADVELIALGQQILTALGLSEHVTLQLNSLGDRASRDAYRETLVAYLTQHREALSPDSQQRLERNPLRVLDSKAEADQPIIAAAPNLHDSFTDEAKRFFHQVQEGLATLGVSYNVNPRLVRGLDYYSHTVWEFTTDALGAQGTVLAGGRYDQLMQMMGGPDTPGVGWAAGIERLVALRETLGVPTAASSAPHVAVVPLDEAAEPLALQCLQTLREAGIRAEGLYNGAVGKRMKKADKMGASHAIVIGGDEVASGIFACKNLREGTQFSGTLGELATQLSATL